MAETKAETFYAFVGMVTNPGKIFIKSVGCENENGNSTVICESAKTFVEDIPKLFTSKFKAVIFYVSELQSPDFENSIEFCKAVKAQMNLIQIPHYFINTLDYIASGMLVKFNISLKLQGTVLLVIAGENVALVNEFQFTENGYENIRFDDVVINVKENLQSIRDKIYGSSKPQKILVVYKNDGKPTADFLRKNIIKSKNVFMSDADFGSSNDKFVIERSKWLLDKSNTKYYVIPRCGKMFALFAQFEMIPLITVNVTEKVPLEKSAYVSKVNGYIMLTYDKFLKKPEYTCLLKMKDACHRMKITLTVDAESFPTLDYDLFEIHKVTQLPETLNKKVAKKIPFVGFYDDCSVICVFNEKDNGYKFLDAWNGI
uniref:Uncharacterized protein n=1 Tax=Panagrolaimus davidi TaxID=227884 RepID=A0A914PNE2_9BILA